MVLFGYGFGFSLDFHSNSFFFIFCLFGERDERFSSFHQFTTRTTDVEVNAKCAALAIFFSVDCNLNIAKKCFSIEMTVNETKVKSNEEPSKLTTLSDFKSQHFHEEVK